VLCGYRLSGRSGILKVVGRAFMPVSGSKSGKNAKSMVLESFNALSERDVLNCLVFGIVAALAVSAAASSIAACTLVWLGFWVVRKGDASGCGVIRRPRVCVCESEVGFEICLRARRDAVLEAAITVDVYESVNEKTWSLNVE
jgi:hypothetical protein